MTPRFLLTWTLLLVALSSAGCESFSATAKGDGWAFWSSGGSRGPALTEQEKARLRADRSLPSYQEVTSNPMRSFGQGSRF